MPETGHPAGGPREIEGKITMKPDVLRMLARQLRTHPNHPAAVESAAAALEAVARCALTGR